MEFELGRGSYLREYQSAMPAYGLEEMYTFITPSPIFTLIQYCSPDGVAPSQIITIGDGVNAVEAVKDKAFDKFLTDNGYVRSNSESDREYTNEKELMSLKVYISEKPGNQGVNLTFKPITKQIGEYKTFDKLPYYPLDLLQKANVKVPEIEQFEKKAGSKEEIGSITATIYAERKCGPNCCLWSYPYFLYNRQGRESAGETWKRTDWSTSLQRHQSWLVEVWKQMDCYERVPEEAWGRGIFFPSFCKQHSLLCTRTRPSTHCCYMRSRQQRPCARTTLQLRRVSIRYREQSHEGSRENDKKLHEGKESVEVLIKWLYLI